MSLIRASLGDGRERTLLADPIANALITLPNNHSYIHKGQHFKTGYSDQPSDINAKLGIAVGTPGWVPVGNANHDTMYHMVWRVWSAGPMSFGVYEDVTSVSGGTIRTPMNNNRQAEYTTDLVIQTGPLARTGGDLLLPLYYTGGATGFFDTTIIGFATRDDDEILLKSSSLYVFELTSLTSDTVGAGIELAWYEYVPEM